MIFEYDTVEDEDGGIVCVWWNENENKWDSTGCSTIINEDENTVMSLRKQDHDVNKKIAV